jgi:hypothetical protein
MTALKRKKTVTDTESLNNREINTTVMSTRSWLLMYNLKILLAVHFFLTPSMLRTRYMVQKRQLLLLLITLIFRKTIHFLKLDVLTTVKMLMLVFRAVKLSVHVGR